MNDKFEIKCKVCGKKNVSFDVDWSDYSNEWDEVYIVCECGNKRKVYDPSPMADDKITGEMESKYWKKLFMKATE
jgi:hypothetical protein